MTVRPGVPCRLEKHFIGGISHTADVKSTKVNLILASGVCEGPLILREELLGRGNRQNLLQWSRSDKSAALCFGRRGTSGGFGLLRLGSNGVGGFDAHETPRATVCLIWCATIDRGRPRETSAVNGGYRY